MDSGQRIKLPEEEPKIALISFLRSDRALTQTAGRAARNLNGKAIMYADKVTKSMDKTINDTNYRRTKQKEYNWVEEPMRKGLNLHFV